MEHEIFLNIADNISKFSKCASKKVGCVIVKNKRIISSGCNGTPPEAVNCNELFDFKRMNEPEYRALHHKFSESMECHAEENAILIAARHGISIENSIFYVSMKPCERCLKMIAALGVKKIFYRNDYDMFVKYNDNVNNMIEQLGISIVKINNDNNDK